MWRAELINKSDLGKIFKGTNDTQELGLRQVRPRSAQVLCHKSVPLGSSLQMGMCMPVWGTLTSLAPLLKPAELG